MPELPEVETMVRGIRDALTGAVLVDVAPGESRCRPICMEPDFKTIRKICRNQQVTGVRRRAKRIVIDLENSHSFVIEPRMTGLMLTQDPPTRDHLRFQWILEYMGKRASVWFWDQRGLGTLRLVSREQLAEMFAPDRLGPDALEMTVEECRERFRQTQRAVKVALLDQKVVAGIGNLYASEILHRAGIHPVRPANTLSLVKIRRLHAATAEILTEAIRYEGSTLSDGTYRNALNHDGSYQNQHRVYAKAGSRCPSCGRGTIERIVQAQRSTFYCARCQK